MTDLIIAGRLIGTYEGWDEIDVATFGFHNYNPIPELGIFEKGSLVVSYDGGFMLQARGDDMRNIITVDLIETLKDLPIHKNLIDNDENKE